ncbi:uncharacterized protein BX663DRAFT_515170 [Cokeromyces recurvatus]|uniref:uncharacterized protein n=1 Tax=Cokeromyces recurvatus TaxID=90255 RepID=UPI00221EF355|nr:uncharacterized protein BX663DRAFT_515170 [Cokeromyces recurvatus]KAI7901171.1 hypothetical protein BX663DRAFT_515170 [Cokeromyces recurvatus]
MAGKTAKSSIPTTPANKDLSCLRCRKKKAKCSKTRPTCTRCARSNQPCEYPDAPPNLTDLSQKVLNLYDTLRELEGEFLIKYMQSLNEDKNENINEQDKNLNHPSYSDKTTSYSSVDEDVCAHDNKRQKVIKEGKENDGLSTEEPAGWSISLTSNGLSIHAITRNFYEFDEFAKSLSRQTIRDFGPSYLPKNWDPDAEGYFEDTEDDELDEDEYLVTVPVFSTRSLLQNTAPNIINTILFSSLQQETANATPSFEIMLDGADPFITLIQSNFPQMIKHLNMRYEWLEKEGDSSRPIPHHLVILMHQLKMYLPDYAPQPAPSSLDHQHDPLLQICILTAYVVSITLLPPDPSLVFPPLPTSLWRQCAEYATMLLFDLVLQTGDALSPYPVILCAILLAWIETELVACTEFKADTMVHIALRVLCNSDWKSEEPAWQILIATLLYLDVYSATFRFKVPQVRGEGMMELWKAAVQMREPSRWDSSFKEAGIVLEARLMSLLNKVISLFYQVDDEREGMTDRPTLRKIDVDEVLTLVRDIELWEQELPEWAKWNTSLADSESSRLGLKMHMHMIHNMVKILLFRPFSTEMNDKEESEQTLTKTTFLDMSTVSSDRLTTCLCHIYETDLRDFWTCAASSLVRDVSSRVLKMFDKDEEIVNQLDTIQQRLEKAETIKRKLFST